MEKEGRENHEGDDAPLEFIGQNYAVPKIGIRIMYVVNVI